MEKPVQPINERLDAANPVGLELLFKRLSQLCGYGLLVLVFLQFAIVVGRYALSINFLWAQELVLWLHASIFLLGAGWTLLSNRHVQIDVISFLKTPKNQKRLTVLGAVLLLLPMMLTITYYSLPYVQASWAIFEGSAELSGLPGLFLVKSLIPLFSILMVLAGLGLVFRSVSRG